LSKPTSRSNNMSQISWLIPTYNEEQNISQVIKQIPVGVPYVFDKSSDETPKIAAEVGAIVINRKGSGKGDAIREGLQLLSPRSDIIVIIDGDNTYSPLEVHPLLEELKNGADMAIGSRFLGHLEGEAMSRLNMWGNKVFNFMLNRRFKSKITDLLSGFRAIQVSALEKIALQASGFEIEVELTAKFLKNKLRVIEKPITYRRRCHRSRSKLNHFRDGFRVLLAILES